MASVVRLSRIDTKRIHAVALCVFLVGATACSGELGGPSSADPGSPTHMGTGPGSTLPPVSTEIAPPPSALPPVDCNPQAGRFVAPSPLRRLTNAQYNQSVQALVGEMSSPADAFPAEAVLGGYDNQGASQQVQRAHVERWESAAQTIAAAAAPRGRELLKCGERSLADCVPAQLPSFGLRLFRRPLSDEEQQRYVGFYTERAKTATPERAFELTLTAMLLSPHFLFLIERGIPLGNGLYQLTGYEVASRLSFALRGVAPDEQLLAKAGAGQLDTAEAVALEARSLLNDASTGGVVQDFVGQWIGLRDKSQLPPGASDKLAESAEAELEWFIRDWYGTRGAKVSDLFLSPRAWVDAELAESYGVTPPSQPSAVDLPAGQRPGILTRLKFLSAHANPPARGSFVLSRVLCMHLPPPPAVVPEAPSDNPNATTRERFDVHATNPCATSCHSLIDPVGFAFEHYDQFGLWRDEEKGKPINAAVELDLGLADVDGSLVGAQQLAERLASSRSAGDCLAENWFKYSQGRDAKPEDQCSVKRLQESLARTGDVKELIVEMTQMDAFRFVRKEGLGQ